MKDHDKMQDWCYQERNSEGRRDFYTTDSFETNLTFILADFFRADNHTTRPDSTTVYSFYHGEPDEARVEACLPARLRQP